MANDFSSDTNCVALWRFENGAITTDSKGSHTLTNVNVTPVSTSIYQEGGASADFTLASSQYLYIADSAVSSDFPYKSGTTNKIMSVCGWFRHKGAVGAEYIFAKYHTTGKRTFGILTNSGTFSLRFGYNSGDSGQSITFDARAITGDVWYHVGVVFDDSDQSYYVRLYDSSNTTVYEQSGNYTNAINVEDADYTIGASDVPDGYLDGYLDELAVFKDKLTAAEIDQIRAGTYTGEATSTGEVLPASATTSAIGAWTGVDWVRTAAILSQGDATAAAACISDAAFDNSVQSYLLKASNFGISIPAGYSVAGVICRLEAWATLSCCIDHLKLLDTSRVETGDNEAASVATTIIISATTQTLSFGGSANNWGCSLSETWVENANFGVAIGARALANNADLFVDYVTLEVCYVAPPAAATPLSLKYFFVEC